MTIRAFDEWAGSRLQTLPLADLTDAFIGIEAAHYLDRLLKFQAKEPLLSALGGFPFSMKRAIEDDLDALQTHRITPIFFFSGIDVGNKDLLLKDLGDAALSNAQAWEMYDQHQAQQAVETFGNSGSVKPESLFTFFQRILQEREVNFKVAPYSAAAQLAYFERHPDQYIDAVMGSSELFLFDVEKVITEFDSGRMQFTWLSRSKCQEDLGKISDDMFVDAGLLSGSSLLPSFPPLENPALYRKPYNIRDVVSMLTTLGKSVAAVCTHYQDDPHVQHLAYLDRYKRGRSAVKHHVVLTADGRVAPLDGENAPSDVHEFIGQRLPDELYFYLSRGIISSRVLEWLTSGVIWEAPPLEGGESEEYRNLIRTQLIPIRTQTLSLLAHSVNRYYQTKEVRLRFWFDRDNDEIIRLKNVASPRDITSGWKVKQSALDANTAESKFSGASLGPAVAALNFSAFTPLTILSKESSNQDQPIVLETKDEILSNTLWRFLHLRGYINSEHTLTTWGKVLHATISAIDPPDNLLEPAFITVELLRLNLLNVNGMFPTYTGAPIRGSETDKRNCLLVSRIACLGKLRHRTIGFTGPLSRNLLAYHSLTSAVRQSLRDLVETSLATLLLNGDAERDRDDWEELSLELPFIDDNDCALGIAVKSYLDELAVYEDPSSAAAKDAVKAKGPADWIPNSVDFVGDLYRAFKLWDAVYAGVKVAGKEVQGGELWTEVDQWLAKRR
ncbi:MAG: hypothetical protein M1812_004128 [Candelaria pacifica]|nr:MAG: hypothetical protein M1812_004128 [Candelaria pacifica]